MISLNSNSLVAGFEHSATLNDKLREWATLLIAGCLTGDHLRRVAEDDRLISLVASGGISQALEDACEELRPNVTQEDSLRFDLAKALRKLERIIAEL